MKERRPKATEQQDKVQERAKAVGNETRGDEREVCKKESKEVEIRQERGVHERAMQGERKACDPAVLMEQGNWKTQRSHFPVLTGVMLSSTVHSVSFLTHYIDVLPKRNVNSSLHCTQIR